MLRFFSTNPRLAVSYRLSILPTSDLYRDCEDTYSNRMTMFWRLRPQTLTLALSR